MSDLYLCKKFASLEGVSVYMAGNIDCEENLHSENGPYKPITDLSLNCAARDKYCAEIDYDVKNVVVWLENKCIGISFSTKEEIPRAVIECILKSKGKL